MEARPEYPARFKLVIILFSLFLGTFLVAIDTTIVSVAIPKISTQFEALSDVGWYGSAYLITITALQPAGGTMYKFFNAKIVYLSAIVVFEAGSTLCAAAPNSPVFIVGRAIAGSGAALLIQGAISIITQISPLEKRPLYIGLVVSCFGISASFSPILGGALTVNASWRWCFWINLPIGAVVFGLVLLGLNLRLKQNPMRSLPWKEKLKQLDPLGIVLLLGGVSCLFLALQWGGSSLSWNSREVIGLFIGFGLLLFSFCALQWQLKDKATIPLSVLRQRTVLFGGLALFFISMSSNIKLYYLPFFFQAVQGVSALHSGISFLALAVPQVVATVVAGGLATKLGHYFPIMVVGTIICTVGTGLLIKIGMETSTAVWVVSMAVAGFGDGMCTNLPYSAIQGVLKDEDDVFIGNAIATFFTLAGGAIGISIGENILIVKLIDEVPKTAGTVPPQNVITAGALNLPTLTSAPNVLHGLRQAYSIAISNVMICATVTIGISIVAAMGMQRLNLNEISRQREARLQGVEPEMTSSVVPTPENDTSDLEKVSSPVGANAADTP